MIDWKMSWTIGLGILSARVIEAVAVFVLRALGH